MALAIPLCLLLLLFLLFSFFSAISGLSDSPSFFLWDLINSVSLKGTGNKHVAGHDCHYYRIPNSLVML